MQCPAHCLIASHATFSWTSVVETDMYDAFFRFRTDELLFALSRRQHHFFVRAVIVGFENQWVSVSLDGSISLATHRSPRSTALVYTSVSSQRSQPIRPQQFATRELFKDRKQGNANTKQSNTSIRRHQTGVSSGCTYMGFFGRSVWSMFVWPDGPNILDERSGAPAHDSSVVDGNRRAERGERGQARGERETGREKGEKRGRIGNPPSRAVYKYGALAVSLGVT